MYIDGYGERRFTARAALPEPLVARLWLPRVTSDVIVHEELSSYAQWSKYRVVVRTTPTSLDKREIAYTHAVIHPILRGEVEKLVRSARAGNSYEPTVELPDHPVPPYRRRQTRPYRRSEFSIKHHERSWDDAAADIATDLHLLVANIRWTLAARISEYGSIAPSTFQPK